MFRKIWVGSITKESCPKWPCRICNSGHLRLDKQSLHFEETVVSQSEHADAAWEPDWTDYCFSAWATCSNIDCKQRYAISGNGSIAQVSNENGKEELITFFTPKHCYPMPDIFRIPKRCPKEISTLLKDSFALYFADTNSCAGKIRCAIEKLMDHLEIPSIKDENHKQRIPLHGRLKIFEEREPQLASNLLAIKWLANAALHENTEISNHEILDVYEIIEHTLKEIINQRTARIAKLAQKLKDKHSPQG